ncbi:MAG: 3-deoxy-D-manno-octulosonic acid transferase [Deltaproteobacteria bacterium]|nr:3-deoxy-D-manno-octulosonic acid transferase [Deltaproteobacteria bacterium]
MPLLIDLLREADNPKFDQESHVNGYFFYYQINCQESLKKFDARPLHGLTCRHSRQKEYGEMDFWYAIYTCVTGALFPGLFAFFLIYTGITGRYRRHLRERLGLIPLKALQGMGPGPRIWIHAVSLGEVRVAESIINALRQVAPECAVVVSTTTEHGRILAEALFKNHIPVVYSPIDFLGCVRTALRRVRPDVMVFLETEIWPAWISEARRLGIRTALINGRVSPRSINGYLKFRPFFKGFLHKVDAFSMISREDAARIRSMGALPHRIAINGNAKYEILAHVPDPYLETDMRQTLALDPSHTVIVAGSTRHGEEEMILDAYVKCLDAFPDTILIIVPRHIDRTSDISKMVRHRGLTCQLRTGIGKDKAERTAKVVIFNTFGELFKVYSVATIVFCGGSLAPLGGQNPLEPAVWGKPVLYGPSMEDFSDAKALLESARAAIPVATPEELSEKLLRLLNHPQEALAFGRRAREAALKTRGAALGHAKLIAKLAGKS